MNALWRKGSLIGRGKRGWESVSSQENSMCAGQGKSKRKARFRGLTGGGVLWGDGGVRAGSPGALYAMLGSSHVS